MWLGSVRKGPFRSIKINKTREKVDLDNYINKRAGQMNPAGTIHGFRKGPMSALLSVNKGSGYKLG